MNLKKLIQERFGDEMSGYVYTGHQDLEDFSIEVWNKAIDAAAKNASVMRGSMSYGAGATVDKQSILKLKK